MNPRSAPPQSEDELQLPGVQLPEAQTYPVALPSSYALLQAALVPLAPLHAVHVPPTQIPWVVPSAHAELAGLHDGPASLAASVDASLPESAPPELEELLESLPESAPPLEELLESLPESAPPLELESALESEPESPPPELEELLESAAASSPPLSSPASVPPPLPELDELLPRPPLLLLVLLPRPLLAPLDVASPPPSSPSPLLVVALPPPHPLVFVASAQPATAPAASQPRNQPNLRMEPSRSK